ncbi:hypothetical protein OPV22_028635 [Ensete ventricosum]|uniref:1-acylglycerol-3-phosphate O-acyltransferase n=1 Tax=Ensete ventricosum TaxID=4639 RepID=A0AAV8Q8Y2_ENSVE|nr:hypothetical protein OPV22_028635 [Ensete ventricosum]
MYISRLPPRLKLQLEYVAHIQRHATPTHASLVRWTRATSFGCLFKSAPQTDGILWAFHYGIHYSRKATSLFFATWLSLWPFLFEKINKTKVIFSGETLPMRERVLLFANHRTEVDWMYIWDLAWRKGRLGYLKYILKGSLMKLPIFGWAFQILEFIAVERKWEIDESIMRKKLSSFEDPRDPLWLVIFPEGTDYTEKKCIKSQQFAAENGLPILRNLLIPKTKGFFACLEVLRNSLDAVYDVTIGYKHRCPTLIDNVFGVDPSEVHIHAQRILLSEIPTSEIEAAKWLIARFKFKDKLLADFTTLGYFPNPGTEGDLSTVACLAKCSMHILSVS